MAQWQVTVGVQSMEGRLAWMLVWACQCALKSLKNAEVNLVIDTFPVCLAQRRNESPQLQTLHGPSRMEAPKELLAKIQERWSESISHVSVNL